MNNIKLSVIIPAYNEEDRITTTLESLYNYFQNKDYLYEILVVDDGSTDATVKLVRTYAEKFTALRIIENGVNRGKGFSVHNGMQQATGEYRLFMDADNSVDIAHLETFMPWIEQGYDVVIGSIKINSAQVTERAGWHRRILGNISKVLIRILAVPGILDTQRGFKLFSASAAEIIFPMQTIERFGFDIELLVIAWVNGFKIKELPVVWNNPAGSKVTIAAYIQTFRELLYIVRNRITKKYTAQGVLAMDN